MPVNRIGAFSQIAAMPASRRIVRGTHKIRPEMAGNPNGVKNGLFVRVIRRHGRKLGRDMLCWYSVTPNRIGDGKGAVARLPLSISPRQSGCC